MSGIFEIKIKDTPWSNTNRTVGAVQSRLILLDVLQCLHDLGYSLRASLDLGNGQGGSSFESSGEMWFCCR